MEKISPAQLICPLDVHVARVAKHFRLLGEKQTGWAAALDLTEHLKRFDINDPVNMTLLCSLLVLWKNMDNAG